MDDLFVEQTTTTETIDEGRNYLEELVGDDKKFKSVEDLARGKAEADAYIQTLTQRLDEQKNQGATLSSLKELLSEIKTKREETPKEEPQPSVTPDAGTQVDPNTLKELLESMLNEREQTRVRETNSQKVQRVLEENFGAQATAVLNQKARELGMSLNELKDLSMKTPTAFFRLVGAQEGAQKPAVGVPLAQPGIRTASPSQTSQGARGKSYYDNLKRTNPKLYFDQKTTVQMHKDMQALGISGFNNM